MMAVSMSDSLRGAICLICTLFVLGVPGCQDRVPAEIESGCQDRVPAEIELFGPKLSLEGVLVFPGEHVWLQVGVRNKYGDILDGTEITYSSSAPKLIEISPEGVLWCREYGRVDITISTEQTGIIVPVECAKPRGVGFWRKEMNALSPDLQIRMNEILTKKLIRKISNSD